MGAIQTYVNISEFIRNIALLRSKFASDAQSSWSTFYASYCAGVGSSLCDRRSCKLARDTVVFMVRKRFFDISSVQINGQTISVSHL